MNQFLIFSVGRQTYAFALEDIREIVTYREFTRLPDSRPWVVGMLEMRGQPMPIIDLRIRFATVSDPVYNEKTVIIATKLSDGKLLGFVVDEVRDIRDFHDDQRFSAEMIETELNSLLIRGYIQDGDTTVLILDHTVFGQLNAIEVIAPEAKHE